MTRKAEKNDGQKQADVAWREQDQSQAMDRGGNLPADQAADEFERLRIHYSAEALMKSLAHSFEEEFAAEYDRFMEESPDFCLPEDLDRILQDAIQEYEKGEKQVRLSEKQARRKKYTGVLLKACVFVLAISLALTFFAAPQASALREKIYKIFTAENDGNMGVTFREESEETPRSSGDQDVSSEASDADKTAFPEGVEYLFFPSDMPEGYELEEIQKLGNSILIDFYNEVRDDWITMEYSDAESEALYIDTDHSRNTAISIDGQPAMLQETADSISVFWVKNKKLVCLDCSTLYFNTEQSLEIANNMQWYNKENFEKIKKIS